MKIILYHTADRNRDAKLIKDAQGDVDLPPAAVHHDEIREAAEAAHLIAHSLFVQLTALLQAMGKTAGQHLLHARIIIRSLYGLDLEFTVIAALRFSLFIDDHRTDGLKAADIGNVVCLHTHRPVHADQILDLMYRSDRPALLALDPFAVLPQYDRRIFPRHLDQLFLRSLLRNPQVNLLSALLAQP